MKKVVSLALSAIMALSLVACNKAPEKKAEPSKEPVKSETPKQENTEKKEEAPVEMTKVRVAYMGNLGSVSSIVAAQHFGYFKEQGLDVSLTKFASGPPEIAAMGSGDIDIAQIGHGAHKLCIQGKAQIFQMDATSLADAVIGNADKGVKTIADLKGKKVATTKGTSAEIILKLALKEAGLKESDLEIIEMDANGVVPAMVTGQIDACSTWSPGTFTIAEKMGDKAVFLADNSRYVKEVTFPSSFICTADYAKDHKDVLVRFATAIQKGQDRRITDLDEVVTEVAKLIEQNPENLLKTKNEGNWATSGAKFFKGALEDGTVAAFYQNQQDLFVANGAVKEKVDLDKYILFDIMKEANVAALK